MDRDTEQISELVPPAGSTADGHTPSCCTDTQLNLNAICSPACTQWPGTSARSAARLHLDLCQPAFPVGENDLGLMQTRWSLQQVKLRPTPLIDPRLSGRNVIP